MQILSFSIPCLLSTPIAAILFAFICSRNGDFFKNNFYFDCDIYCDAQYLKSNYCLVLALLWTLSLHWTSKHIWFPEQERIAKVERYIEVRKISFLYVKKTNKTRYPYIGYLFSSQYKKNIY